MDIHITFPGGKKVNAEFGAHVVQTDQSGRNGGEGSAPEPFSYFLASLGTCAGIYVLGFCQSRNLPTQGLALTQRNTFNATTHALEKVAFDITVPDNFPEKYVAAVKAAAENCAVKKVLHNPPAFDITVSKLGITQPTAAA